MLKGMAFHQYIFMVLIVGAVSMAFVLLSDFTDKLWGEERKVGGTLTENQYLDKILTAPCLTKTNLKGIPYKSIFDKQKLEKGDISCIDFSPHSYYFFIENTETGEVLIEKGDRTISADIVREITIVDGKEQYMGRIHFGLE